MKKHSPEPEHLLTTRAALVLLVTAMAAFTVAYVVYQDGDSMTKAIIAGLGAIVATLPLASKAIGP